MPAAAVSRTCQTRSSRSRSGSHPQAGMADPGIPRRSVRMRSSSLGIPLSVLASRNRPAVKSRGGGKSQG